MARLKRYGAPVHYPIPKKEKVWTVMPRAGPHSKGECIPLQIIIRDILKHAATAKEVKKILSSREVKVDGKVRTDTRYPCGLMDVVEIEKTKERYRILPKGRRLTLMPINEAETKFKLCQIKNKSTIRKGAIQLNLHDGRNIIVSVKNPKKPSEDVYKVGDTIVLALPEQKILGHIGMEKGSLALVVAGRSCGAVGKIKSIILVKGREPNKVVLDADGKDIRTLKDYIFVIGKEKSKIAL